MFRALGFRYEVSSSREGTCINAVWLPEVDIRLTKEAGKHQNSELILRNTTSLQPTASILVLMCLEVGVSENRGPQYSTLNSRIDP